MSAFGNDEFAKAILSLYTKSREKNYCLKLSESEIDELLEIYVEQNILPENLKRFNDAQLIKKMMIGIVAVYKIDKDEMSDQGEMVQLVNSVNYDGRSMYINFAKISVVKMRRLELGKTQKQIAENMGYGIGTVKDCEKFYCDLSRQPKTLVEKLARALECEVEILYGAEELKDMEVVNDE